MTTLDLNLALTKLRARLVAVAIDELKIAEITPSTERYKSTMYTHLLPPVA
jgi:hypothetical protein